MEPIITKTKLIMKGCGNTPKDKGDMPPNVYMIPSTMQLLFCLWSDYANPILNRPKTLIKKLLYIMN